MNLVPKNQNQSMWNEIMSIVSKIASSNADSLKGRGSRVLIGGRGGWRGR